LLDIESLVSINTQIYGKKTLTNEIAIVREGMTYGKLSLDVYITDACFY